MTNNAIVEQVFKTYNISKLIKKLISNSSLDKSSEDLEQYIYLQLLEMDNIKLNKLYETNLVAYITNLIKNQRNIPVYSTYGKYYKIIETENVKPEQLTNEDEYDYRMDFIYSELCRFDIYGKSGLTQSEEKLSMCYELYKFKIQKNYSLFKLAKHFHCRLVTVVEMIKYAQKNIKNRYDDNFDNDTFKFMEYNNSKWFWTSTGIQKETKQVK